MITTALTFLKANKMVAGLGAALLLFALITGAYFKGRSDGKQVIRTAVAEASLKASEKARKASEEATNNKDTRDETFNETQKIIKESVDEAIRNDNDPITAFFNSLSDSQSGANKTSGE